MQASAVLTGEALTDVVHYMQGDECDTTIKMKDKRPLQFQPWGVCLETYVSVKAAISHKV